MSGKARPAPAAGASAARAGSRPAAATCRCCGGSRLAKIGEIVTETLDVVPRRWFVRQTVREKFTCRDCETISEPPAPFHVIPRGRVGASLLAMILFEKYGAHQPLNRQSERYAREGVDLDLSTMADHVGAGTAALAPLHELIRAHVLAAERLHGDDTTLPVSLAGVARSGVGCRAAWDRAARWARRSPAGPRASRDARSCADGSTALPALGLCPRRPALRPGPDRAAGSALPLFPRPPRRASGTPPERTMPGSCRPMPIVASPASTRRHVPAVP